MPKSLVWIGVSVGSLLGSWLPSLFGAGMLSLWGVFGGFVGAIVGIWVVFKLFND